jgi:acyl-homoserine-lactone acylase
MKIGRILPVLLVTTTAGAASQQVSPADVARWNRAAANVTITRDDWGIPHIRGRTDADAVFGLLYAQAEDDFNRVERNYLNAMGRVAEADGESAVYSDLRMKIFANPDSMKAKYATSPAWLKALMNAYADGLNYYLYTHPQVKPAVITHFEPWMALAFSEGSIGWDVETINLEQLAAFYGGTARRTAGFERRSFDQEYGGSNGIAIAPSNTLSRHALFLINPHTSFFFRAEVQVASDEGLNAYGAVTWGQFFVYQGFNSRVGWMHTSSGVDAIDEYLETIIRKGDRLYYRYGAQERPVLVSTVTVPYRTPAGMATKQFTVYRTRHGPVVREMNGKWVTVRLMQDPVNALIQSYTRTKARDYKSFRQTMEFHTNSSNNTVFADADGNIAYFHANFIPRRDPRFDWTKPVDGANPATEWHGLLAVNESPNILNPHGGWVYNSNNWPWSAAGPDSPKRSDYPAYVERSRTESFRGLHAMKVLQNKKDFTLNSLISAAYDSYLTGFAVLIPSLIRAYDAASSANPLKARVSQQIELLRKWDYRWGMTSVPTSLAVFWGEDLQRRVGAAARAAGISADSFIVARSTADQRLQALASSSDKLTSDFGTWRTPWGEINRFQRIDSAIVQPFSDSGPSIPVAFTSAKWGSLASFSARQYPQTKRWYGTSGNSFVAVVEFGPRLRAKVITAGGESGQPRSPHFNDQATRYSTGALRDVYFYPSDLEAHIERKYHPGG